MPALSLARVRERALEAGRWARRAAVSAIVPQAQRRPLSALGQIGLCYSGQALSLAAVVRGGARPRLTTCDFRPLPRLPDESLALRQVLLDHGLQDMRCNFVLAADEYQFLLVDAPEVPPSELRDAVRWRVHELIGFPVADAVIDVFDMPRQLSEGHGEPARTAGHAPGEARGHAGTLGVVVSRSATIAHKAGLLNRSGAGLEAIDTPEFALRNIAELLRENGAVALLHLERDSSTIQITRGSTLYLSRRLPHGTATLGAEVEPRRVEALSALAHEVLRSLEYYEARFAEAPVAALRVTPLAEPVPGLLERLTDAVDLPAEVLDLNALLDAPGGLIAERQARCLLAIGGALRVERTVL